MTAEAIAPPFVSVIVCAALDVPSSWSAKFSGFGDAVTLMPSTTPARATTWFVLAIFSVLVVKVNGA